MKQKDLPSQKNLTKINNSLHQVMYAYMDKHGLRKQDLAKELNISPSAMSQLFRTNVNHSLNKIVELAIFFNKVPIITFVDLDEHTKTIKK